jgi:catechol 2,3-dioxygenase-like lactoylglutathione lyase family enzyme
MIKRLAHICINTSSLPDTERFYCQGLGMTRRFDFEKEGSLFGYYLDAGGGTFIEVFSGEPGEAGNINHLALEVDDIDAAISQLRGAGFDIGDKAFGSDDSWQAWTADPNGVRIELHQYTPESCQLTGRTCQVTW